MPYIFSINPMLVINATDVCNMKCKYCPPYGENLQKCEHLCSLDTIEKLIEQCSIRGIQNIRITGGEPLLVPDRAACMLKASAAYKYTKVVFNTNGSLLRSTYAQMEDYYRAVGSSLLFKISLDTVSEKRFKDITCTSLLSDVLDGILLIRDKGYRLALNAVVSNDTIDELIEVVRYCKDNRLDIKLLTLNNFGGRVVIDDVSERLRRLYPEFEALGYTIREQSFLNGNTGIQMDILRSATGNMITIVDHSVEDGSLTQKRVFAESCKECPLYPCATGVMNIILRADGLLQPCRTRPDMGVDIDGISKASEFDSVLTTMLAKFDRCFTYSE